MHLRHLQPPGIARSEKKRSVSCSKQLKYTRCVMLCHNKKAKLITCPLARGSQRQQAHQLRAARQALNNALTITYHNTFCVRVCVCVCVCVCENGSPVFPLCACEPFVAMLSGNFCSFSVFAMSVANNWRILHNWI